MSKLNLSIAPAEATRNILKRLPTKRMKDVIEKRFGLKGAGPSTLDGIGKEYKITRERVRQIEADALKHLGKEESMAEVKAVLAGLEEHLKNQGEVMAEHHLFSTIADAKYHPHLSLLLYLGKNFYKTKETDQLHHGWATNSVAAEKSEKVITAVMDELERGKKTVSAEGLHSLFDKHLKDAFGEARAETREAHMSMCKVINSNPYGEYGLAHWPVITPRGIRDKAYLALTKAGNAMHFLEIAKTINKAGWSGKKAHPQTVHNELIKDERFVLVGRGLYALCEWGYEPGVVREVLVSVLKKAGRPLSKEELVKVVTEKRFVKSPTILLNLQNKKLFKRTEDGKYILV